MLHVSFLIGCLSKAKEHSLANYLPIGWRRWVHAFSKGITVHWNANGLIYHLKDFVFAFSLRSFMQVYLFQNSKKKIYCHVCKTQQNGIW